MKLISRKKKPTPVQKALGFVKLGVRGLVLVRVARNAFKTYKFARRLPLILGGGAVVALVLKKLRGGGDAQPAAQTWQPTPATTTPAASPPAAPAPSTPAAAAPTATSNGAPNPVETAATGSPEPTNVPEPPPTVAAEDGPELSPEGGDIAPELADSEKPSSPS